MNLSINIKGTFLHFDEPKIMGILNVTPDSFSDGGKFVAKDDAIKQAEKMVNQGASIIDVGGYSSRPGAANVLVQEELDRVLPVVEWLSARIGQPLSIDTFRSTVAEQAVKVGAGIVNDISAGDDDADMLKTVAELGVPYIAMHKKGTPQTMQDNPTYGEVVDEVKSYLNQKLQACKEAGIKDVIIDPGFGFGKTVEHNYALLSRLDEFQALGSPILVGISRKSMICKVLGVSPANALNGTTFLHNTALQKGSNILRVHDVKEAQECILLWKKLSRQI